MTKSVISLLKYYSWKKFSIIYEEVLQTVAKSLEKQAKKRNMTVNDIRSAVDRHKCCEQKLPCCESGYWYQFIQETKNRTRSKYVILIFHLIELFCWGAIQECCILVVFFTRSM